MMAVPERGSQHQKRNALPEPNCQPTGSGAALGNSIGKGISRLRRLANSQRRKIRPLEMNKKGTILVLDDDVSRHEVFRHIGAGFRVTSTYHVLTFAQALQADPPDLISLDHDLIGGVNADIDYDQCGCDACELVAKFAPSPVPVLIHSANGHCAQVMRRILVASGRRGKVSRVNTATVMEHGEKGGLETLRGTIEELLLSPCWPEDATTEELLEILGDDPRFVCPVRVARRKKEHPGSPNDKSR